MSPLSPLLIFVGILVGSVVVGLAAAYFLRARTREAAAAAPPANDGVRAISEKIDQALAEQRVQGETQRQLLAQKLDGVRDSVESQRTHVEGLRSELRHEVRRRDAEIEEIRQQIGSIRQAVTSGQAAPAALPPAPTDAPAALPVAPTPPPEASEPQAPKPPLPADPPSIEPPAPEPAASEPSTFGADPFGGDFEDIPLTAPEPPSADAPSPDDTPDDLFSDVSFSGDSFAAPLDDPFATAPPHGSEDASPFQAWSPEAPSDDAPTEPEAPAFEEATFEDFTFEEATFDAPTPADEPPAPAAPWTPPAETQDRQPPAPVHASADEFFGFETPAPAEPADEPAPAAPHTPTPSGDGSGLVDLDALAAPAPEPDPAEVPEGAEDLTVISTIDEDKQRLLYQAGVRTLEEIAQWGRSDARRISGAVDVSEDTIMNQWVFEAQAALFRQYAAQAVR